MASAEATRLIAVFGVLTVVFAALAVALRAERLQSCLLAAAALHAGAVTFYAIAQRLAPPPEQLETVRVRLLMPTPEPALPEPPARLPTPLPTPPEPEPESTRFPPPPDVTPRATVAPAEPTRGVADPAAGQPDPAPNNPPPPAPNRPTKPPTNDPNAVPVDPRGPDGKPGTGPADGGDGSDTIDTIHRIAGEDRTRGPRSGPRGEEGRTPRIDVPPPGGRVYFIRLKHGQGDWNAHADGTARLLRFLDPIAHAEAEGRAYEAKEIRDGMMAHDNPPAFIYIHCDESFTLTREETAVLRTYVAGGGFLFLDSRPDEQVHEHIATELKKVMVEPLEALPASHPIYSFVFRLRTPAVGQNLFEGRNYGVTQRGRLVAFYTPGNFMAFYSSFDPNAGDYVKAQYQMGVNVMVYAINKGELPEGMGRRPGANSKISAPVIDQLGGGTSTAVGTSPAPLARGGPHAPGGLKLGKPRRPGASEGPDEIKVID